LFDLFILLFTFPVYISRILAIKLPSRVIPKGILLLGPPGVGKTFSLKVLQAFCSNWCDIKLYEIKVSDILCSDKPVELVHTTLAKAYHSRPEVSSSTSTSSRARFVWTPTTSRRNSFGLPLDVEDSSTSQKESKESSGNSNTHLSNSSKFTMSSSRLGVGGSAATIVALKQK